MSKPPVTFSDAYSRASSRCAQRECCRQDISLYLGRMGCDIQMQEEVLDKLEDEGFIDESRYARAFVHDKTHYDRWGPLKVQAALHQKGIGADKIGNALAELSQDLIRQNLLHLLQSKCRQLDANADYIYIDKTTDRVTSDKSGAEIKSYRERLIRFALSRGYDYSLICELIAF